MEQQPPTVTSTSAAPSPSTENLPPPQSEQPTPSSVPSPSPTLTSSASTTSSTPSQNPNPTPIPSSIPQTSPALQLQSSQPLPSSSQPKPPVLSRPWQQPQANLTHFSSHLSSSSNAAAASSSSTTSATTGTATSTTSTTTTSSSSTPASLSSVPPQRGGVAMGLPALHSSPPAPSTPFSSSLGQHFSGLGRGSGSVPESSSASSQVRPTVHGIAAIGSMGPGSQMRPGGILQQRPMQSSLRPPSPTIQSSSSQLGHGLLRGSAVGSPISQAPSTSQNVQSPNQPWLTSASQGKPPLPSPSYRPQMSTQSLQQRSHTPQQHHPPLSTALQQQYASPTQSQFAPSNQSQEQHGQQFPPARVSQSLPPQQVSRTQGSGTQKTSSLVTAQAQPTITPSLANGKTSGLEGDESWDRILGKRSIHELVTQIDPSEKLDPEVEDILVEIAEEFVESITSFGCTLAKHRKSTTLEAKDILLPLEKNWNITLPGFSGDEVKSFRKPVTNEVHKERLALIKRSIATGEVNTKSAPVQVAAGARGNTTRAPANVLGSPNLKS